MLTKITFIKFYLIAFFAILSINNIAQENNSETNKSEYSFTLEEAKQFALENNIDVKNAMVDKVIAKRQVWETTAIGLPQASASYKFKYIPGDIPTFMFGEQEVPLDVASSATYDITLSQLIFSGEYLVGLQASKTFLQLSDNNLEKSRQDVQEIVSSNYFSILILEKNKELLDSSVINLHKILDEMIAMKDVGFIEKTDVDQIQLSLNITKNALKYIERQIEILYKIFKISIGLSNEDGVSLTDNLESFILGIDIEGLVNKQFVLENNIDYRMIYTQEKISNLSLRREQSKYLPRVSAYYFYQDKTNKADFDFTINHIIGVNVNVPIFSSGQRYSKVQQAKLDLLKAKNSKELVSENLIMMTEQSKYDFLSSHENYKTQQQNIELSKEIYYNTLVKYKEGMVSSMDLSQAHQQYLTEQSNYFSALLELLNAKLRLEKVLNQ